MEQFLFFATNKFDAVSSGGYYDDIESHNYFRHFKLYVDKSHNFAKDKHLKMPLLKLSTICNYLLSDKIVMLEKNVALTYFEIVK